jgi:hypothetical protein
MKIIYKQGDLLDCIEKVIVHGCNAQGVMGSGVALAIRKKYPDAARAYFDMKDKGRMQLGCCTYCPQDEGVSVKILRKYLKKAGVEVEKFNEHYTSMKYFVENNPTWSAYAAAGIILELKGESI